MLEDRRDSAGAEFCSIIKKRYPRDYERAEQLKAVGYQDLMAEISAGERRDLLAEQIDNAKLNWAHIALAQLIKQGYIARVLTPNFDPLVVQACALLNVFPAIYDLAASQTFKAEFVTTPAVIYLHGQRSGFRLLNTERECEEHAMQLRPVFDEAGARRPWIACLQALQGRVEEARELLFVAKREGGLPSREHLLEDDDLNRLRDLPWFAKLIDGDGDPD